MDKLNKLNESITSRGYEILKVDTSADKVLVHMPNNEVTPYVVWSFNSDGSTFWGHYHTRLDEAEAQYNEFTKYTG